MSDSDLLGWLAGAFVVATFYADDAVILRALAIVSNILFIIYALTEALMPVMVLHGILLPLNAVRLRQLSLNRRE